METVTEQQIRRTALRGKAFDQHNRGLITNQELSQQLLLISTGAYDEQEQGQ